MDLARRVCEKGGIAAYHATITRIENRGGTFFEDLESPHLIADDRLQDEPPATVRYDTDGADVEAEEFLDAYVYHYDQDGKLESIEAPPSAPSDDPFRGEFWPTFSDTFHLPPRLAIVHVKGRGRPRRMIMRPTRRRGQPGIHHSEVVRSTYRTEFSKSLAPFLALSDQDLQPVSFETYRRRFPVDEDDDGFWLTSLVSQWDYDESHKLKALHIRRRQKAGERINVNTLQPFSVPGDEHEPIHFD